VGGIDQLEMARQRVRTAKSADELRAALAVVLPLDPGLSLAQTAKALGRSASVVCRLRTRYCKEAQGQESARRPKRQLRNRASATLEEEARILDEVIEEANTEGILAVPPLQEKIQARLGKPVSLATIYRMLARHGWRKNMPDERRSRADAIAREDRGENSRNVWRKSS
jgi:transposase